MTRHVLGVWLFLAVLIVAGGVWQCQIIRFESGSHWVTPLASLLVAVPAVYTLVLMLKAKWQQRRAGGGDDPVAQVRQRVAQALAQVASDLPLLVLTIFAIGLSAQVVMASAKLIAGGSCGAPPA